jgi:hypothetical protein
MIPEKRCDNSTGTSDVEAIQRLGFRIKILKNAPNFFKLLSSAFNLF